MIEPCARIHAIRPKNVAHKVMPSLSKEEVDTFLAVIPQTNLLGLRDYAMFRLLHNVGARVSEIANLRITDLRLEKPFTVSLIGKGNKQRIVPIWDETVEALSAYLNARAHLPNPYLFLNYRAQPITRFGIGDRTKKYWLLAQQRCPSLADIKVTPHTFRHTCAFEHVAAGNAVSAAQDWLGHADINTTRRYFKLSMEMKQKALESIAPPQHQPNPDQVPKWQEPGTIEFLANLSRGQGPNPIPTSLRVPPS